MYLLTVLFMFAAMEGGYRLGKTRLRESIAKPDSGVGAIVAATLALLAFLLAFVVGFAANIFNERRLLVIDEANAISTAYLRAGYLDEPYRTESRELLREYADMRLAARELETREMALTRSEKIHDELWSRAEVVAREDPVETIAIYIESINEVIDIHTERVSVGVGMRVPPTILLGLYLVALGTMLLVGMGSAYRKNRNHIALILLILILSVVLLLIVDLDRSQDGLIRVPQQALIDLQRQLKVGQGRTERSIPYLISLDETLGVGVDDGTPVTDDYPARGNEFNGKINWVQIDLEPDDHSHLIDTDHMVHVRLVKQ